MTSPDPRHQQPAVPPTWPTPTPPPGYATPPQPTGQPWPPQPPTAPKRRNTGLLVGAAVAAALVLVAAGTTLAVVALRGGSLAGGGNLTVHGSLTLTDAIGVLNEDDTHCSGMNGYDDIRPGAQVVVTDDKGAVIATSELQTGWLIGSGMTRSCKFPFTVTVPRGKPFYGIQVSHRGVIQYTQAQLMNKPDLSLGG